MRIRGALAEDKCRSFVEVPRLGGAATRNQLTRMGVAGER
jgi:hypothetical protein